MEENWDTVLRHDRQQSDEGGRYYASVLKGVASAAVVDVGWVGSGAQMLRYMIEDVWKLNCQVTSIVAGTCGQSSPERGVSEAELADGSMADYLFSNGHNRDIWSIHDAALGHNMLVELLLCAAPPSFREFRMDQKGSYEFNAYSERIDSEAVQQGIMQFVECWQHHPWGGFQIAGRDAMAPVRVLYDNEDWVRRLICESGIRANIE